MQTLRLHLILSLCWHIVDEYLPFWSQAYGRALDSLIIKKTNKWSTAQDCPRVYYDQGSFCAVLCGCFDVVRAEEESRTFIIIRL